MSNRSIIVGAGTFLMACLHMHTACAAPDNGLTVARNGKALARIILPSKASAAAQFAAAELRDYLSRISRATFAITSEAPLESPRIFVGDCGAARAKGLDVGTLKRDGFYRAVIDNDLYILGRDDPDPRWERGRWAEFARKEHGTVNGVYDFLEDVCGVRWFMPGKLGEVVPEMPTISVPDHRLEEEPVFADRQFADPDIFHYPKYYPDAAEVAGTREEQFLWLLRLRWGTIDPVPGCHSTYHLKYAERYAEKHPQWFSLMSNGKRAIKLQRGSYVCWSQAGLVDQMIEDARAYLTGRPPSLRGLESWYGAGYGDTFMLDPHDAYEPCLCPACTATRKKYEGPISPR